MRLRGRPIVVAGLIAALALVPLAVSGTAGAAATPTASFTKVQDWGSGWEGQYTITNSGASHDHLLAAGVRPARRHQPQLALGRAADPHRAAPHVHQLLLERHDRPGRLGYFGFVGTGSGSPVGCTLNGQPCAGGATPTTPPPTTRPPTTPPPTTPPPTTPPPTTPPPAAATPVAANGQLRVCGASSATATAQRSSCAA